MSKLEWGHQLGLCSTAIVFFTWPVFGTTYSDIRSKIFGVYCLDCHSEPGAAAGLDLSNYQSVMASGVIAIGKPDDSILFQKLDFGEMPKGGEPLSAEEVLLVREWIDQGAVDAPAAKEMTIKQVSPRFGPTTGGTEITIEGDFFDQLKQVRLGVQTCTKLTIIDPQHAKCTTPAQTAAGLVSAILDDGMQQVKFDNAFEYRLPLAPTYESLYVNIFKPKCMRCHSGDKPAKQLDLSTLSAALAHRRAVIPYNVKKSRLYKKVADGEMPKGGPRLASIEVKTIRSWIDNGAPEN